MREGYILLNVISTKAEESSKINT